MSEPVRAPIRDLITRYSSLFEHLLHAIKNEIVERVDGVDNRLVALDERSASSDQTTADQLALQAAAIRSLQLEVDRLMVMADATLGEVTEARDELRAARKELEGLGWDERPVGIDPAVDERIVEQPFVFAALADLPLGSRVVDIGGGDSTVALALASLGHRVTVVEPRGYPFSHPNLTVHAGPIETFEPDAPFDAAVLLSTIGHIGLDRPGGGGADVATVDAIRAMVVADGRLVLTAPYGHAGVTDQGRVYDRAALLHLVEGWLVGYAAVAHNRHDGTWEVAATELDESADGAGVVMLVATNPAAS